MEALSVGIQDIGRGFCRRFAALLREGSCRRLVFPFWLGIILLTAIRIAVACRVVDDYPRLHIVAEHAEQDTGPVIRHGLGFHQNACCYQIIASKHRGDAIQYMIAGLLNVVSRHVLKWQHSLYIQRSRPGNEVPLVGVLSR